MSDFDVDLVCKIPNFCPFFSAIAWNNKIFWTQHLSQLLGEITEKWIRIRVQRALGPRVPASWWAPNFLSVASLISRPTSPQQHRPLADPFSPQFNQSNTHTTRTSVYGAEPTHQNNARPDQSSSACWKFSSSSSSSSDLTWPGISRHLFSLSKPGKNHLLWLRSTTLNLFL
jgi:hypothetical protein